jgi:pimeloyl-ACP methyl ester carboxylesterase
VGDQIRETKRRIAWTDDRQPGSPPSSCVPNASRGGWLAVEAPETRYVETPDGIFIAYQVIGDGPVDVAWQFDWLGNVDLIWDVPMYADVFEGIASFARLILHDRRATGLSSGNIPPPNLETRAADLQFVLDTVGSPQPVLAGELEGGAASVFFAASYPERTKAVVWIQPRARSVQGDDYPWGTPPEELALIDREFRSWGTIEGARLWAESEAMHGHLYTEEHIRAHTRLSRGTATPDVARQMTENWHDTDVRSILPLVRAPCYSPRAWLRRRSKRPSTSPRCCPQRN